MRHRLFLLFEALVGAVIALLLTAAVAAQQAAPQTLVYTMNMTSAPAGHMGARPQTYDLTMTISIGTTDADGTRHATMTMASSKLPGSDKTPEDTTISPSGAILPKDTTVPKPHMGMTESQSKAMAASALSAAVYMQLIPFNAFADACAQQKTLTPGTTWQASAQNGPGAVDVTYTVKGAEQKAGRNVMLVTVQSAPSSAVQMTGQGDYDPVAHLVVNMHYEGASPNGRGTRQTVDIGLVNS